MILVTGAGGGVGRALVRDLHGRGEVVRAFVKNESQARHARADGATHVVIGDVQSSDDIQRATIGIRKVFHANPTSIVREVGIAEDIVAASHANGVEHIVYHSVIHPDIVEMFHHQEKGRVEDVFRESGIPSTFLRASHFMAELFGLLGLPARRNPPVPDVAEIVDGCCRRRGCQRGRRNHPVRERRSRRSDVRPVDAGADAPRDGKILSEVLGHDVSAVRLPPEVVRSPLRGASAAVVVVAKSLMATNVRAPLQVARGIANSSNAKGVQGWSAESRDCYVRMMEYYDENGLPAGDMTVLPELLGRPATSYREFAVREAARRGIRTTARAK